MTRVKRLARAGVTALLLAAAAFADEPEITSGFAVEDCTFSPSGGNRYFVIDPGHVLVLENAEGDERVVITMLADTEVVDGVTTRVMQEAETAGGRLVEMSRNFVATCQETGDVFYFGEDVDVYHRDGRVTHGGAWRAGENGATAGILMPGRYLLGARYYQEVAPDVALDHATHTAMGLTVEVPAGVLEDCVEVTEGSPLEGGRSLKVYAPGIGLVVDDDLRLVSWTPAR